MTFEAGWDPLEVLLSLVLIECPYAVIESKQRRYGMFNVKFVSVDSPVQQLILDGVTDRLERKSAKICEKCGKYGEIRRNIDPRQVLCIPCYSLLLSDAAENQPKKDI